MINGEVTAAGCPPISALGLARVFLEIGATSFGGLGPSLAIIERELVDRRPILTASDVAEAMAATRLLPGSSLVQVASFLGYRIRGWSGSVIATVACILPPSAAMLLLAAFSKGLTSNPALVPAVQGVTSAVIGLLLASLYRFGRATIGGPAAVGVALAAFASALFFRVPAAVVVVAAGLTGIPLLSTSRAGAKAGSMRGGRS